ncbi:hypothetical protein LAZ67_11000093 [Cordylochernes scorpioides]|uniref:Reverse transcriptase domain-containing protein n=1 Tax=Cordylochernes scorpioides TaxID=51811 RepID=A0ABY6L115_9ARAC|nr:hypothetical protein LAZ67_11000093 [Cordylochernes scorpioides]
MASFVCCYGTLLFGFEERSFCIFFQPYNLGECIDYIYFNSFEKYVSISDNLFYSGMLLLLSCPIKSLRCIHASPSQQQQCPLSWVCKAAALGLCQISARLRPLLAMRICGVKYKSTLSKTFKLYQGLPQGSVLRPTLFTLFIAGIEERVSHKTNIGLFADDIILWSSNTNWKKAERDLSKTLLHLEKFANKHKLEFNPQKSETCLFTTNKKLYKMRPNIILKEQQWQYNKHPKYLGYTLDPEINSSKHIEGVVRKGRDRLKILKYISGRVGS